MHIPDNYLSPTTCAALVAAMAPVWTVSLKKVRVQIEAKKATVPLIGVGAAFAFLIMMFNVPVPGGTTAHAVGATLLAILLGPWAACLSISIALLLQAFVFGDGGILAYGANVFNMGFIMPFVGYSLFMLGKRFKHPKLGAFVGGYFGINFAALAAGVELGIQPLIAHTASGQPLYSPYPLSISVPAMLSAHMLVVGWIEAVVTVLVYQFVQKSAPDELYETPNEPSRVGRIWLPLLGVMAFLSPLGLLASGDAWGEWDTAGVVAQLKANHMHAAVPRGMAHGMDFHALLADYGLSGIPAPVGYVLSAATALILIGIIVKIVGARHAKVVS
ncbi:cobalt transporter CbiM [Lacticaseibacillus saniviri]|uniref:Cobalt transport protein CbiM n=1 Tax=Lacticaseibacillus saniviri JCM 17471 = DSM 24301 TaxID=1293598 RepID=A0A0R2N0G2_9LACO|nr:cobalt transporter CbiM [Lacticaseibacillus saniviri]KRO17267.1 cobalt transport protein CbiM [Lacticaseibacillus saniviri JCM 17471 = DSM 24301]MCG4282438.1 cobalt transporter CbiM [Lacticaseibacillus saniviri]